MATIRIPEAAESLLSFCRTSASDGPHIWETYADMIAFLAAYAYGHGEPTSPKPRFGRGGNPIDLGVFRSRGLYPLLLTLAIAEKRDWLVAKGSDEVAAITERYAEAGARLLSYEALSGNVHALTDRLVADLQGVPQTDVSPKI